MDTGPCTLHRISFPNVSCYLVYKTGEAMLVDCGNAGSEVKILKEMASLGLRPGMLRLLVLTHAHFDHAGSAGRLKELTGCRIMVHRLEEGRLREGFSKLPAGTRWKAKLLVGVGRTLAQRMGKFPPAPPDLLVDDAAELSEFGFPGRVFHTPGHTVGSMVVLLPRGELLAGDTFFGVEGKQHFPPFAEDLPQLVNSWKKIRGMQAKTIFPAHGRSFSWESFLSEFDGAMERYG
jgi:hydroxyacylglutathione hydrolase